MAAYNPGEATVPVKVGEGRYAVDSYRGETKTYEVDTVKGTCTCPHWVTRLSQQERAECKHLKACRDIEASQPKPTALEKAQEKAAALTTAELYRYAEQYRGEVAGAACLLTLAARKLQEQPKREVPAGVECFLQGATEAERERALRCYR